MTAKLSLHLSAPGLSSRLTRSVSASCISMLNEAFKCSAQNGGLGEGEINRTEGASFNPRPARICQLLLEEAGERTPETLAAGMLICTPSDSRIDSPHISLALTLARSFDPSSKLQNPSLSQERLQLAYLLDEIRHLHMLKIDSSIKEGRLKEVRSFIPEAPLFSENKKLSTLLHAALNRLSNALT